MKRIIIAAALLLAVATTAAAKTPQLAPIYKCTGVENGENYTVWLTVEQRDRAVRLHQLVEDGSVTGVAYGFLKDKTLVVTLSFSSGNFGTARYEIKGKKLAGEWQVVGYTEVIPEACEVAASLPTPIPHEHDHSDNERVEL